MISTVEKRRRIEFDTRSNNHLSLLRIEADYITPDNCYEWLSHRIPAIQEIIDCIRPYAKDKNQKEAIKVIEKDISVINGVAVQVSASQLNIPVVFEGYHLLLTTSDLIFELLEEFLSLIVDNNALDITDIHQIDVYRDLMYTQEYMGYLPSNIELQRETTSAFHQARTNKINSAA